MGESDEFNTLAFEKKLSQLKDTQESIQSLSSWCLKQRVHHKKIVSSWLNVLKRVKVEQRLTLFYLANDVIQYSKRKNYEFVASWGCYLQKATPLVRDDKVRTKILRIFKIWGERSVFDEEFLSDLTGLLSVGATKKTADDDSLDFQPQQLVNKIRQCSSLEADTDLCLKIIHDSHLDLSDADALCVSLKGRRNTDDVQKDLLEGIAAIEKYTQALQKELVARRGLLGPLSSAIQYYFTQRGEVKVVALAYKKFGQRVRTLKRALDALTPTLPHAIPSPPLRDEDVPSPGPDEDLDLPQADDVDDVSYNIDKTFSTSLSADGSLYNLGLSSFLSGENPMQLFADSSLAIADNTAKKIEVINNVTQEKQDLNINELLKNLIPTKDNNNSDNNSVGSATLSQKSQEALPGLDLLTPESTGAAPPPTSFYGAIDTTLNDEPEPYCVETHWNNTNNWSVPMVLPPAPPVALAVPPPAPLSAPPPAPLLAPPSFADMPPLFPDTPESPPPAPAAAVAAPRLVPDTTLYSQDLPSADVDHRGVLPPPPPPPVMPLIAHLEDVDHRLLPSLPPPPVAPMVNRHPNANKDVDHRNLISLTHQASPQRPISRGIDQLQSLLNEYILDYRVPAPMGPNDIVESVDMDLSEDEETIQQMMYPSQQIVGQNLDQYEEPFKSDEDHRRHSYNPNNKVLVGGHDTPNLKDTGKRNVNLIRINSVPAEEKPFTSDKLPDPPNSAPPTMPEALTAPPSTPLLSLFDNTNNVANNHVPNNFQNNILSGFQSLPPATKEVTEIDFDNIEEAMRLMDEGSNDSAYTEDIRSRFVDGSVNRELVRNPSPPHATEEQWEGGEWAAPHMVRPFMMNQPNPRFQRNWNPVMRTPFRHHGFAPPFWPRNAPRTPNRPWMGPRPQRFW